MISPAALLFAALLASGPARAASDPAAYDAKAAPLDDLCKELLAGNGYEIHDDGQVWDKIGEAPVARTDMPYLLSRLASAKRLRALLEINNIITRYDAERKLTPEDKEAVRVLVRQNWVVFGIAPRNDFRSYFSVEELESLNAIPPRFESMGALTMTDPAVESVTAAGPSVTALPPAVAAAPPSVTTLPPAAVTASPAVPAAGVSAAVVPAPVVPVSVAPPSAATVTPIAQTSPVVAPTAVPLPAVPPQAAPQAAAPAAVPAPAAVVPTLTPMMALPSLARGSPFASAAPVVTPTPMPAAPAVASAPPPAAPSTSSVVLADLGTLKPWTPPPVSTTTAVAPPKPALVAVSTAAPPVAAAPPPPVAAPAPPEPPKAVIGEPEYAKFVAEGPYNKEGKAILELIEKRAPDYCLPLLRRTVVGAVPQIVSDGARTGAELRAGFTRDAANPLAPPVVALSPGPVFVEVKKGLFGSREAVLLPESPEVWSGLGVARPPLDALRENAAPVSTENGDWGAARVYADGSRRGSYSSTEMAGELLEQLLLLGLAREGLDASAYAARRWARTARLMFYARLKEETQQDNFLDPDRRAELRGWLDHPDETDDLTAAVWSGSRRQLLDPRRGPPGAALEFESSARAACVRSTLEDALVESSRRRAARVGELESLLGAGVVDDAGAKSAAQAASDAEEAERRRLVAAPPACPAPNAAREEGLRKAALLLAESTRAERLMRERKAGIESHAL